MPETSLSTEVSEDEVDDEEKDDTEDGDTTDSDLDGLVIDEEADEDRRYVLVQ